MGYLIVAALAFGAFYLMDRSFTKLFRDKAQHKTGLAVKLNKRYALFGIFLGVLGICGLMTGIGTGAGMLILSLIVLLMGAALLTYYLTFGIFYDADSFILTTFGKKSVVYRFSDIQAQLLYTVQGGGILIELHMADGRAVSIQSAMEGAYPFLDHAFAAWCRQKGIDPESCEFHDPSQSLWFPTAEVC